MSATRLPLALLPLALLVACESMDAPGHPFAPGVVQAETTTSATTPPAAVFAPVPGWEDVAPFEMTSEDFVASASPPASPTPADAPAAADAVEVEPVEAPPEPTNLAASPAPVAAPPLQGMGEASGWPIRLVKAIPDAVPPRAIVGLPDGTELVVTPGAMLAAQGLIVMAIGKDQMQLAQVKANGDHATVVPMTLLALY